MKESIIIILLPIFCIFLACNGKPEQIENNVQNSQKLMEGMTLEEALDIMGEPYEVREFPDYQGKAIDRYYYESPYGTSDWIHFSVDSSKKVIQVTPYPPD